ncbi:MAG: multifunctional fatty acid oxidation complex subunit alpha, partial [Planctomycetes bacterium]|nr:multifunctional fatty acid oxidation complex subunit alpha [Planctomycetota bacterium]
MTATHAVRLSFPEPDIALLSLNDPNKGANILSQHVLAEFSAHLDTLAQRKDIAGLIICSEKPGVFILGADIREFIAAGKLDKSDTIAMATRGIALFRRLSQFPFPTVSAINGICVGGGAELSTWCDRRLMTNDPKTQIGFPEVKLGIFPGWGGTVRTPRIVGLGNALELITTGESISAQAAYRMGYVTDLVPAEHLLASAISLVRSENKSGDYLKDRQRWSQPIVMGRTEFEFLKATADAQVQMATKGQYPAPVAAVKLMMATSAMNEDDACRKESEAFADLFGSPVSLALINVFFLTDRNKKDTGIDGPSVAPRPVRHVGVIGAGIMGSGIAGSCLKRELTVSMTDARPESLSQGVRTAIEEAAYDKAVKGPSPEKVLKLAPQIHEVLSESDFSRCD